METFDILDTVDNRALLGLPEWNPWRFLDYDYRTRRHFAKVADATNLEVPAGKSQPTRDDERGPSQGRQPGRARLGTEGERQDR